MNLLKYIKFERRKSDNEEKDTIYFFGEVLTDVMKSYATFEQIRSEIVKEIVKRLENDLAIAVETLKPQIIDMVRRQNEIK